jgi:hypothetical protein
MISELLEGFHAYVRVGMFYDLVGIDDELERIAGVPTEIRNEYLRSASLERYRYASLFLWLEGGAISYNKGLRNSTEQNTAQFKLYSRSTRFASLVSTSWCTISRFSSVTNIPAYCL